MTLPCPKCKQRTDVLDTRLSPKGGINRRRECPGCGYVFATTETIKWGYAGGQRIYRRYTGFKNRKVSNEKQNLHCRPDVGAPGI